MEIISKILKSDLQDLRALRTFGQDYPEAKRTLVYRGEERLVRDGISIEPCTEFLLGLR